MLLEIFRDHCPVTVEIAQDHSVGLEADANVLFNSTGDEDWERNGGVFFEEVKICSMSSSSRPSMTMLKGPLVMTS
jgi:hypothetical protein